jgi:hypothetical protein
MSPRSLATREDWIAAGREFIDAGQILADTALVVIGERVGEMVGSEEPVSTGSFYSHFPDGVGEYYAAVIQDWADRAWGALLPPSEERAVRDPRDLLRLIRSRWVAAAGAGGAMRRWAGRAGVRLASAEYQQAYVPAAVVAARAAEAAQAAVAVVDREVTGQVHRALEELGLTGDFPGVVADVIVRSWVGAYHTTAPGKAGAAEAEAEAQAEKRFDVLLAFIGQRRGFEVAKDAGDAPDEVVLYLMARGLPEEERRELVAQARQFIRSQDQQDAEELPVDELRMGLP